MTAAGETLRVYEVGPRDGLQNERAAVDTASKLRLIEALWAAGVRDLEATSFVSPRAVPQMADAAEVMARLPRPAGGRHTALIINDKGYDRAVAAGCTSVAVVVVITETLCGRNNRMTVSDSVATASRLIGRASSDGVACRVYLAPAFVCPFEGPVPRDRVLALADSLWEAGARELAIADTIGQAHPREVGELFAGLVARFGAAGLAAHLHDTQALGLANAAAAIAAGVRTIDASIGGLGGCPFAPGAAGNLATEDVVLMAEKMGLSTGIELDALWRAVDVAGELVGRTVGGRTGAWWRAQRANEEREVR